MDKRRWLVCLAVALLVAASALVRAPREEVGYRNEDATWHVLLTVTAYDETPKSQHLFLPIVSLGGQADKGIPWGGTIPDAQGNYYYTSFSPAAFFVAWAFIRLFGLPVSEGSLYLLNSVLLAISALVLVWLLSRVYARSRFRDELCLAGGAQGLCQLLQQLGLLGGLLFLRQAEQLRPGAHRGQQGRGGGRGEQKHHVGRGLLQHLQQGVLRLL